MLPYQLQTMAQDTCEQPQQTHQATGCAQSFYTTSRAEFFNGGQQHHQQMELRTG